MWSTARLNWSRVVIGQNQFSGLERFDIETITEGILELILEASQSLSKILYSEQFNCFLSECNKCLEKNITVSIERGLYGWVVETFAALRHCGIRSVTRRSINIQFSIPKMIAPLTWKCTSTYDRKHLLLIYLFVKNTIVYGIRTWSGVLL